VPGFSPGWSKRPAQLPKLLDGPTILHKYREKIANLIAFIIEQMSAQTVVLLKRARITLTCRSREEQPLKLQYEIGLLFWR